MYVRIKKNPSPLVFLRARQLVEENVRRRGSIELVALSSPERGAGFGAPVGAEPSTTTGNDGVRAWHPHAAARNDGRALGLGRAQYA